MNETMRARVMVPAFIAFAMLVALFAGLVNADVAKAYDLRYEVQLAGGYIDLSSRTEPIPLYKSMDYLAVSQNAGAMKNLKISNKSVASIHKESGKAFSIVPKKCGTATISYKQKGKTKRFKVKVINYVCPVKTLKVGKYNCKSEFKRSSFGYWGLSEASGKIKVVAAPGWHVSKIYVATDSGKIKSVKNGYKAKWGEVYAVVLKKNGSSRVCTLSAGPSWNP